MGRGKAKPKEPFWKKFPPELKRLADHIGKSIDNGHAIDYAAALICVFAGYKAGEDLKQPLEVKAGLAASGLIAYQAMKSRNLVAGASGIAYLASLGLINAWNPISQAIEPTIEQAAERAKTMPFPFGFGMGWEWPPKVAIRP